MTALTLGYAETFRSSTGGGGDHPATPISLLPVLPVQQGSTKPGPRSATRELTHLLFDRDDRERVHGGWRRLLAGSLFPYLPDLTPAERTAVSYDRLRLVNSTVDDPAALAHDPRLLAGLHEWAGFVDGGLCTLASIHYNLFIGSLLDHDCYGRDLSTFTSMKRVGTFLCTEMAHGNDVASLQTVAALDPTTGGFVLNTPNPGACKFMPNTSLIGGPKSAVVAARLMVDGEDQGIFLFLTPLSNEDGHLPGVTVRQLPPRTGTPVDHCLTSFDHVWLPREAMLEADHGRLDEDDTLTSSLGNRRKRFLRSVNRVTMGKLCMSAGTLGMARAALAIAVRYAHHRHVSGPKSGQRIPVVGHRSHHGRLLHSLANAYAMTFLHRAVMDRFVAHEESEREEVERMIAIAKGWITWQAREITTESRERCGAQGLFPENRISDLPGNIEGGITAEGDNLVIWVKAAAEMLFENQADPLASDPLPAAERDLTDLRFLRDLLASVVGTWQTRARTALRQGPSGDPIGRWNESSGAALEMVSAHAGRMAADAFLEAAEQATDPATRKLLTNLCWLFLLQQLRQHTGDLLAEQRLTVQHVLGLHQTIDAVLAELAPHMMTLVDAFDLPDEFLAEVPIANADYLDHYRRSATS
ncbi:acyl-CoA dehydrogenase family protein [Streptomyces sp. NBC_01244]|uniref:acyl-CoA dehydrogenase family protein n=1 Tax=Streptomyces sp. NBC_01244 TaxID=2903797 RepID=UPI002E0F0E85|nr:acyl-CoA dehydrogenase family protein [Streptomyces sp. NBC_01244]